MTVNAASGDTRRCGVLMPASMVHLSAGRAEMSNELQALRFFAGANSIFCS